MAISSFSLAGNLVSNAQLREVASHAIQTGKMFSVFIESGDGKCVGEWVFFAQSSFPSIAEYNQSFSIALTALTAGKNVRIHNYSNDLCAGANFISISK